jgi:hypothetical protein
MYFSDVRENIPAIHTLFVYLSTDGIARRAHTQVRPYVRQIVDVGAHLRVRPSCGYPVHSRRGKSMRNPFAACRQSPLPDITGEVSNGYVGIIGHPDDQFFRSSI